MTDTEDRLTLATWPVPSDSRDNNWGEGIVIRRPESAIQIFFRFYEFNLFGAITDTGISQADKQQTVTATVLESGDRGVINYPNEGVSLSMTVVEHGVELALEITNRTQRDWPALASLDPCLNPGREGNDDPIVQEFADHDRSHTFYHGENGLELLEGRTLHVNEDYFDLLQESLSADRIDSEENLPWSWGDTSQTATKPVLLRESPDGDWATGIVWEEFLGAQGHNPWNCMHLLVNIGPLSAGESKTVHGKIYLEHESTRQLLERMNAEFDM